MNAELINARIEELSQMQQKRVQDKNQADAASQGAQADINAIAGALQDCQYWLAKITPPSPAPEIPADVLEAAAAADNENNGAAPAAAAGAVAGEDTIH